jgi:predicted small secreted protein
MIKILVSAVAIAGILTGCATVKGAGKDIQSVGQAGQDAID